MAGLRKVWLIFVAALLLGVIGAWVVAQVPCWESCPRDYPDDGNKCLDCCDKRCPNNIARTRCANNCPPA